MKFSMTLKETIKTNVTFFNYEYCCHMVIRCIILVVLTNIVFAEFAITKSNILLIALLDLLVSIYGISFVFIKPLINAVQRFDFSSIDSNHFKTAFLNVFRFFIVLYLLISTTPHLFKIFLSIWPDSGVKATGFLFYNEILINVFSIIKNFLWIKIADSFIKSNFDLIKNKYKKFIYTPALFLFIVLFASCSIATTYFKSFKTIASDSYSNSTLNDEIPEESSESEYVTVKSGLKEADTTLVYSRNEIYTVDTTTNSIICYENEDYKTAKVVYKFENTEYVQFIDSDLIYKQDDVLYFCYPSKNMQNFTKAGFYSINLETKEYNLIIDDILDYNYSGNKLSNTFDCVTNSTGNIYKLLSYDYINNHTKEIQSFDITTSKTYSIKKSNDNFYLHLHTNGISSYYINGKHAIDLKQSYLNNNKWFAVDNYLFIFNDINLYRINNQEPFEIISKVTDINLNEFINKFFYDPDFKDLNPPVAERYRFLFSLDYQTLENTLRQSNHRTSSSTLPFDGSDIELYDYNDSLIIAYNKTNNFIAYCDKNAYTIDKNRTLNRNHFIEFDIENNPYTIEFQTLKPFRYNEINYNKNTAK